MKKVYLFPAVALLLSSCGGGGSFNSGSFDPLDAAGGGGSGPMVVDAGFKPGSFVKTSMDNAAFFRKRPDGDANADKLLSAGTPMKVISTEGSYVKVELDSGEVGFIPSVMVIDQNASATPAYPGSGSEVQVWPLVPGGYGEAAPVDPDAPVIPTLIDPDAPEPEVPALDSEVPALDPEVPEVETPAVPEVPPVEVDVEQELDSEE